MSPLPSRSTHLIAALFLAACTGGGDAGRVGALETTPVSAISLSPEPELVITSTTGLDSASLSSITDATLLTDGIAVLDRIDGKVYIYDFEGHRVRSVGRRGRGPGEFTMPSSVETCGRESGVSVWNRGTHNLIRFDAGGVEQQRTPVPGGPAPMACHLGLVAIGHMTGQSRRPTDQPETWPMPGTVELVAPAQLAKVLIVDTPIAESRPLGAISSMAFADSTLIFATGKSDDVVLIPVDGEPRRVISLGIKVRRATAEEFDAAIEALVSQLSDERSRDFAREMFRPIPPPDSAPAFRSMLVASNGQLWVTRSPFGDSTTEALIYDLEAGRRVGNVSLPPDSDLLAVSAGRLLVRRPDRSTGGAILETYRVIRDDP